MKRFNKTWKTACQEAGIGVKLFHDFRRTAVRNLIRAGVSDLVAMKLTGHKTRDVFDRYNITIDADLIDAGKKLAKYHGAEDENEHQPKPESNDLGIDWAYSDGENEL